MLERVGRGRYELTGAGRRQPGAGAEATATGERDTQPERYAEESEAVTA